MTPGHDLSNDAVTRSRLAAIVTSSADAIIGETLDGIITDWNPAAERLYGYAAEEAIGQHLSLLAPDDRAEEPQHLLARVCAGESVEGIETVRRTKDGRRIEVSLTVSPVWNDAGEVVAASGISRDITQHKAAEAERAATHQNTRQVLERISDGFYALDRTWRFTYLNETAERLTGRSRDELLGRNIWEAFAPAIETPAYEAHQRAMREEIPTRVELFYAPLDIWLEVRAYPSADGLSVFFLDVSDRVVAQETQGRLAAIVESADDAIISGTLEGTIASWNRGAERLYGYRAEEMLGRSFTILLPDDQHWAALEPILKDAMAGERPPQFETARRRKDGSLVEVAVTVSPVRNGHGVVVGLSTITRDITTRKQIERELQAALGAAHVGIRAQGQFLAMMSHELRTPMQAVLGYADLLLAGGERSLTPEQVDDVQAIRRGAERMMALVTQMLDLSRLEAGRMQLATGPVDLGEIIAQVRQDVAPQAASKGLDLHIDLPPDLPPCCGDTLGVQQILLNLAGNAVKFTPTGVVHINAGLTDDDGVAVAVRDTGIGIPPDALPHIFEEFRQVDGSMARRHEGAGLGLAIAKMLAEQMDGRISVESCPAVGSTFTLHLPRCRCDIGESQL